MIFGCPFDICCVGMCALLTINSCHWCIQFYSHQSLECNHAHTHEPCPSHWTVSHPWQQKNKSVLYDSYFTVAAENESLPTQLQDTAGKMTITWQLCLPIWQHSRPNFALSIMRDREERRGMNNISKASSLMMQPGPCHPCRAILYWLDTPAQTVMPPPPKASVITLLENTMLCNKYLNSGQIKFICLD